MHLENPNEGTILAPLPRRHPRIGTLLALLTVVIVIATYAYARQWDSGLGVTGLNRPIYMGIYIIDFIFFIGLAHSGTFISAILRLVGAEWRKPLTRAAEAVTLFSLPFGVAAILIDLGRPDRALNLLFYGRFQSPLLWDATAVSLYLLSSTVFFYLSLLPDIALCRDRANDPRHPLSQAPAWQRRMYQILALNWYGNPGQFHRLEKVLDGMAIFMTLLVVTVHTVVSFVFSMTIQPAWHTAVLGPFFLVGAVYSGVAAVVVILAALRKVYHLENALPVDLFNKLRKLVITFSIAWIYMMLVEFITTVYGGLSEEMRVVALKLTGQYSLVFWAMVFACFVIPLLLVLFWGKDHIGWMVAAGIIINIGMWLERFIVVVPTEARPRLLTYFLETLRYRPTLIEIAITAALFAGLALLYAAFTQLFPIIPIWETAGEGQPPPEEVETEETEFALSRRQAAPVVRIE